LDPKNYKSYDELKAKLNRVLGEGAPMTTAESISLDDSADYTDPQSSGLGMAAATAAAVAAPEIPTAAAAAEDDDTLSYFAKLASS
jgi:hypothetical protein